MTLVYIVDDVKMCRLPLNHALVTAGYRVEEPEPTCVFDLLCRLRQAPPDLLVTDLEMPGCSGVSLIRSIREDPVLCDTPILVISQHREDTMVAGLSQMNIQGFLIKPVEVRRFVQEAIAILDWVAMTQTPKAP